MPRPTPHLRRGRFWLAGLALACGALAVPAAPRHASQGMPMVPALEASQQLLDQYQNKKDPLLLRTAGEKLETIDLHAPRDSAGRLALRQQTLAAWAHLLATIDAARDPAYDPRHPPDQRVEVPPAPGQPVYPPGISPAQVSEPGQRAAYEKALADNLRRQQQARAYWDLEAIDVEVSGGLARFLKRFYTSAVADQKELQATLEAAGLGMGRLRKYPPR